MNGEKWNKEWWKNISCKWKETGIKDQNIISENGDITLLRKFKTKLISQFHKQFHKLLNKLLKSLRQEKTKYPMNFQEWKELPKLKKLVFLFTLDLFAMVAIPDQSLEIFTNAQS